MTFQFRLSDELIKIAPHLKDILYTVKTEGDDCIIEWVEGGENRTDRMSANKVAEHIKNDIWVVVE